MAEIVLDHVTKRFPDGALAVDDVNLTIADGEVRPRAGGAGATIAFAFVTGERYLLGSANWTFSKFFGRLERLTKVSSPWLALPSRLAITGANLVDSLFKQWDMASPVEPGAIEMAQYFWYLNCAKATRELGFKPRDPGETLHDTVAYLKENFLGSNAFGK
jgi:nucleoside-diphosphate-sugar epimerase